MADEGPDVGKAIRTYLRESTVLVDVNHVSSVDRIFVGFPRDKDQNISVPVYTNMIIILTGRGGAGDIGLALQQERVDIQCYGSNEMQCKKIARALDWYINPLDTRRQTSFTRDGCQVNSMIKEGGPLSLVDASAANWPYTSVTYIVTYCGVPAS